jgi:hypothetical protein
MTYQECVDKAHEAVRLGIIEFEKLDAYAEHLYETHKKDEKPRERESWHNRP